VNRPCNTSPCRQPRPSFSRVSRRTKQKYRTYNDTLTGAYDGRSMAVNVTRERAAIARDIYPLERRTARCVRRKRVYVSHVLAAHRSAWKAPLRRAPGFFAPRSTCLHPCVPPRVFTLLYYGNTVESSTVTRYFIGEGDVDVSFFAHARYDGPSPSPFHDDFPQS